MEFYVTPLIHPTTIRQGNWHKEPAQNAYLARLVDETRDGSLPKRWECDLPPDNSYLYPSLAQLDAWWVEFKEGNYDAISHDLETAGQFIICDGLTPFSTRTGVVGRSLCLRFRGHGGVRWWSSYSEHERAVRWLGKVLGDPAVAFCGHNIIGFDIPMLEAHGFEIPGRLIDTMVLMSRAYPEFPKGLQYCATLFLGAPAWKRMVKDTDDGAEKT